MVYADWQKWKWGGMARNGQSPGTPNIHVEELQSDFEGTRQNTNAHLPLWNVRGTGYTPHAKTVLCENDHNNQSTTNYKWYELLDQLCSLKVCPLSDLFQALSGQRKCVRKCRHLTFPVVPPKHLQATAIEFELKQDNLCDDFGLHEQYCLAVEELECDQQQHRSAAHHESELRECHDISFDI